MFDAGFSELVLLFIIGLVILGPERLPKVATQLGRWIGKARRTATQLRMQIEREVTMKDIMERQKKQQRQTSETTTSGDTGATAAPSGGDPADNPAAGDIGQPAAAAEDHGGVAATPAAAGEPPAADGDPPASARADRSQTE